MWNNPEQSKTIRYNPKQLKSNLLESGDIETSTGEYSYIRFEFTFEK